MRTSRSALAILLTAVVGLLAGAAISQAQPRPSAEVLLPYFELEAKPDGATTLFAVGNSLDEPVDAVITVHSNWGIQVSRAALTLAPREVRTFNLRSWVGGQVPGRSLEVPEVAHLKAALSGKLSPKDHLFYSTPVGPGRFTGYVRIATTGTPRKAALWGDYFMLDMARHVTYAHDLVNLDTLVGCPGLCGRHALRFLAGLPFDGGTRVVVWTGKAGQPSAVQGAETFRTQADAAIFDESGAPRDASRLKLLPTQTLTLAELGVHQPFGWVDLTTETETFVAVQYGSASGVSLAVQAYCLPPAEHLPPPTPGIRLRKLTNGSDANAAPGPSIRVGDPVLWEYAVENTGAVRLTDVHVTDDRGEQVTCPGTALDAGAAMTCTAHGTAAACQYVNVGTVTAKTPDGEELRADDPSHYFGDQSPAIGIEKRTNGQRATAAPGPTIAVGAPVAWTYLVTNRGDVNLTTVRVVDDKGVAVTCPKTSLHPGESMTCTGNGTAVAGQYENVGTVTAVSPCDTQVSAHDVSHYLGQTPNPQQPAIRIKKSTNGDDADTAPGPQITVGAPVLWEYFVTNTGQTALTGVHVTDSRGVAVTCPKSALAVGEAMRCTGNGTATAGQYENIGSVTGTPPSGPAVTSSDPSHYFGQPANPPCPAIKIKKSTNGEDADAAPGPQITVGSPVLWEYFVTNTGQTALTSIHVTDSRGVAVTCPKSALAVGEAMRCTGNGTATAGQYVNIGNVTGTPPSGPAVTSSDPSHYFGVAPPPPPAGDQGCSPGYWKNHAGSWAAAGYSTSLPVQSAFSAISGYPSLASASLLGALAFHGGSDLDGAGGNLLRAATAALLNAAHPGVRFPLTTTVVVHDVNAALASRDRTAILALASTLDADDNLGCPLN